MASPRHPFGVVPAVHAAGKADRGFVDSRGSAHPLELSIAKEGCPASVETGDDRGALRDVHNREQELLLGTEESTSLLVQRLKGRDPSFGCWVDRSQLVAYLADRVQTRRAWRAIPLSLIGFAAVSASVTTHARMGVTRNMVEAAENALGSAELVSSGSNGSPPLPDAAWGWLEGKAEIQLLAPRLLIVGGLRVWHSKSHGRPVPAQVLCEYSAWNFVADSVSGSGQRPGEVSMPTSCGTPAPDRFWQPWALRRSDAKAEIESVRGNWKANTSSMEPGGLVVEALAYNAEAESYALHESMLRLDPSGLTIAEVWTSAFDSRPAWLRVSREFLRRRESQMVADGILAIIILIIATQTIGRCCCSCFSRRKARHRAGCGVVALDAVILIIWTALAVLRAYGGLMTEGLNGLVDDLPKFNQTQRYSLSELETAMSSTVTMYGHKLDIVLGQARRIVETHSKQKLNEVALVACFCLRSLWALRCWQRVSGTLRDVTRACEDILHFLLIVGLTLLPTVALAGHLILGDRLEAFSDAHVALKSTLLALVSRAGAGPGLQCEACCSDDGFGVTATVFGALYAICLGGFAIVMVPGLFAGTVLGANVFRRGEERSQTAAAAGGALVVRASQSDERSYARWYAKIQPPDGQHPRLLARQRAAAKAKFSERLVLEELAEVAAHSASAVSSASLAQALGAVDWAEREQLHELVRSAGVAVMDSTNREGTERVGTASELEATDAAGFRLCARLDANAAELAGRLRPLEASLRRSESCGDAAAIKSDSARSGAGGCDPKQSEKGGVGGCTVACAEKPVCNIQGSAPHLVGEGRDGAAFVELASVPLGLLEAAAPPPPPRFGAVTPFSCTETDMDVEELDSPPAPVPVEEIPSPSPSPHLVDPGIGGLFSLEGAAGTLEEQARLHMEAMRERFSNYAAASEQRWARMRQTCAHFEGRLMAVQAARSRSRHMIELQARQLDAIERVMDGVAKGVDPMFTAVLNGLEIS